MEYDVHRDGYLELPGSEQINTNLWLDLAERFGVIAPDEAAQNALRSTLVNILRLPIGDLQKGAAIRHIANLHKADDDFDMRYQFGWTFPDKYEAKRLFTLFAKNSAPIGLAEISYSAQGNEPLCILQQVQGVARAKVSLEEMAKKVIKSWQTMHREKWKLVLRNPIGRYDRLRDQYFQPDPCNKELGTGELSVSYHTISSESTKLKKLWNVSGDVK